MYKVISIFLRQNLTVNQQNIEYYLLEEGRTFNIGKQLPDQSSTNRYLCYVGLGIIGFFSIGFGVSELIKMIEFPTDRQ